MPPWILRELQDDRVETWSIRLTVSLGLIQDDRVETWSIRLTVSPSLIHDDD